MGSSCIIYIIAVHFMNLQMYLNVCVLQYFYAVIAITCHQDFFKFSCNNKFGSIPLVLQPQMDLLYHPLMVRLYVSMYIVG
jgi:hypothetical protein